MPFCMQILDRLFYPGLCAAMLVVSFSQCFHTLLYASCGDTLEDGVEVCSERYAYRFVYHLIRGSTILPNNGEIPELSSEAIMLTTLLLTFLAAFFVALVISILLSTRQVDPESISRLFWEKKLAFILSPSDFGFDSRIIPPASNKRTLSENSLERTWNRHCRAIRGNRFQNDHGFVSKGYLHQLVDKLLSLIVLPLWFVAGLCSLGILWPPQVRRWLFRPSRCFGMEPVDSNNDSQLALAELKKELSGVKQMALENSRIVQDQLRQLLSRSISVGAEANERPENCSGHQIR